MAFLCEICEEVFKGDSEYSHNRYKEHMEKHYRYDNTPAISEGKYIKEYEVLPSNSDYSGVKLLDLNTGEVYTNPIGRLHNTNINISTVQKLIGSKIRITSYTEIIE